MKERNIDKDIENILWELPKNERKRLEQIEDEEKRLDLQDTLKELWKLRTKERKYKRKTEKIERLYRISTDMEYFINLPRA